jgi:hypothetical protein
MRVYGLRVFLLSACLPFLALCGMAPAKTEINLGPFPIDRYLTLNSDGILRTCPTTLTIRDCVKSFFNNNPASLPFNPNNYVGQGAAGVRFFYALGGGFSSTPFHSNGALQTVWLSRLNQFFTDLRSYGIQRITPTAVFLSNWSGTSQICDGCIDFTHRTNVGSCGQNKNLKFFPWVPFGFLDVPGGAGDGYPDGQDLNNAYNCAASNPGFWGWQPWFNLVDAVLEQAQLAGLVVADLDLENEINLMDFTVEARLIYDNTHRVDAISRIRQSMAKHGFDRNRPTFSVPMFRPAVSGFSCNSFYGESALIMPASEIRAAFAGAAFGVPSLFSWTNDLPCGGQQGTMIRLPVSYTQPTVIDIHSGVCVLNMTFVCDPSVDITATAQALYNGVWSFLSTRGLTGNDVFFGETVSNQNCDGYTQAMATQNVNGFRASGLYANKGTSTFMRPWNNDADFSGCYWTPSIINPPYDPFHP